MKTSAGKSGYQFGTFSGVYVPSLLTILGIIMYLRFGWVLGNLGLWGTLLVVILANLITFLTGLSISALATNMRVGGGGTYYIISRSLGLNAGAAVGIPLFFAQALGLSFYATGFAEALTGVFPDIPIKVLAISAITVLGLLAYFSANLALKAQLLIFVAIVASLGSLFLGHPVTEVVPAADALNMEHIKSFWPVFAVFFPAVTGIEAGVAMSGDLKNPSRSIPVGTLAAILTSWVIYLIIPVFLWAMVEDKRLFLIDPLIMKTVSRWGGLILLGVWGASLSSALSSLLAAPRTLQALARDRIVFSFLGRSYGPQGDPRIATAVTFAIGIMGVLAGDLNSIATLLSMFFLTAYGLLNLSAFFEALISPPSWRPTFKVHWSVSFIASMLCLGVMFMINGGATVLATVISALIYVLLQKRKLTAYWGDIRRGIIMLGARLALYWLNAHPPNSHSWKPNILVLSGSPTNRWYLIALADAISHGKGFLTVATILPEKMAEAEKIKKFETSIHSYLQQRQVPAFVKIYMDDHVLSGAQALVKSYGFGPMQPNTVLLGETEKEENILDYVKLILLINRTDRNLLIVRETDQAEAPPEGAPIYVWWNRSSTNIGLMLAIAYLLKTSPEWAKSRLVIKTIVEDQEQHETEMLAFQKFVITNRLNAEVEVLIKNNQDPFDIMREASQDAGIVFLGMREPRPEESEEEYAQYYALFIKKTQGFPPAALTLSAEEVGLNRIFEFNL